MTDEDINEDKGKKPSFDARTKYYEVMGHYMIMLKDSILFDNQTAWLRALRGLYYMTNPYIKNTEKTELKELLQKISENVLRANSVGTRNDNKSWRNSTYKLLDEATEKIHLYAKHMMLPMSDNEDDTFDMDKFLKESDLG